MKFTEPIRPTFPPPKGELWPPRHSKVDEVDGGHSVRIFPSREVKFTEVPGCHSAGRDR
jgi:hypothetical protein